MTREDGRIPDIWLLGYTQSLERSHPEMTPRQRLVAAIQYWRDQERLATQYAAETRRESK